MITLGAWIIATKFPIMVRSEAILPAKLSLSRSTKLAMTDVATTPNEPSEATNVAGIMMYAKKLASSPETRLKHVSDSIRKNKNG